MTERDLTGRTFIVTGSSAGIGRVSAENFAARGARVFLACRSEEKTAPVLEAINAAGGDAQFLALDLADLASVRKAAETFLAKDEPLHVLMNNAGLASIKGKTKDGFELTIGTNHIGHFLFTKLLLPRLRTSTPARIVNVSSGSHYDAKHMPFEKFRESTWSAVGLEEYAISKLCNVLFTKELAKGKAGAGVTSYSLHPGVIASDIWKPLPFFIRPIAKLFMKSVEDGARTQIYCATKAPVEDDGMYFTDSKPKKPSTLAEDAALASELWTKSEAWVS